MTSMPRYRYLLIVTFCTAVTALSACTAAEPLGADRDAHGCIGSAGYSWCESTQRCERPWELAKQKGFAVSAENFAKYCQSPKAP